jgi:hypothetical protein
MPPNDWPKYEIRAGSRSRMPSPSTSTPTSISRTSCIRSITVCRSPSRFPISVYGATALTPSVESIVVFPSWSIPLPPAARTTGVPAVRLTISVPSAPPP